MGKSSKKSFKKGIAFAIAFFAVLTVFLAVTAFYIDNREKLEQIQMSQVATNSAAKISQTISELLYKTEVLSALVIQDSGLANNFEHIASIIVDDPCVKNVILAPDGVVTQVYPLKGNEAVLGLDYFSEGAGNKEAIEARDTGELVLGGPFDLVQGGMALVGRLPVYIDTPEKAHSFWGLVSVTLNYPQALDGAQLNLLHERGLAFELWRISPDTGEKQIIAYSDYGYNKNASYVEEVLEIQNAKWFLRIAPVRQWYQYGEFWLLLIFSLLFSAMCGFVSVYACDLRVIKGELEEITRIDALTGALNRRGLVAELETTLGFNKKPFTICYLDLNRFKVINDAYGHSVGDGVLSAFARVVMEKLDSTCLFSRIGGDEFVIVIKGVEDEKKAHELLESLQAEVGGCYSKDIWVEFCAGIALYPKEGKSLDELMTLADHRMYEQKKERLKRGDA